jgi:transcriptional regulator with XRE-family HTH domain
VKRPKWLGGSRAAKADKQKKSRQQTDQRMRHQDAQTRGDSKVARDDPTSKVVLSPDDPMAKASKNTARVKK